MMPRGEADVLLAEVSCDRCPVKAARSSWGRVVELCPEDSPDAQTCEGVRRIEAYAEDALRDFGWGFFSPRISRVPMAHVTETRVPWLEIQQRRTDARIGAYFMPEWAVLTELFGRHARRRDVRLEPTRAVNVKALLNAQVDDPDLARGTLAIASLLVDTTQRFEHLVHACDESAARKFIEWVHAVAPQCVEDTRKKPVVRQRKEAPRWRP